MSKFFDLLEILKEIDGIESLIQSQKGTIEFAKNRLQNMSEFDDEERLKVMLQSASHDIGILESHLKRMKEKYETLLESAKSDDKVLREIEVLKVPADYKMFYEILKQSLLSQKGVEKTEE